MVNEVKYLNAELFLIIENNSSYVRGKKKTIEMIEFFILSEYDFKKKTKSGSTYSLSIPYKTKKELDKTVNNIIEQIHRQADSYNTFAQECSIIDLDVEERYWD